METNISPLPKEVERYFMCNLLHTRNPQWDGTYRLDEFSNKMIPNIKYVCKICDNVDAK